MPEGSSPRRRRWSGRLLRPGDREHGLSAKAEVVRNCSAASKTAPEARLVSTAEITAKTPKMDGQASVKVRHGPAKTCGHFAGIQGKRP